MRKLLSRAECSFGHKHYALRKELSLALNTFREDRAEDYIATLMSLPRSGFVQSSLSDDRPY
jgi:hypothetical protein